ncbi:DUF3341 domain-containing protein [Coraliomargarita akajimensis]|uniref:Quinol:cytochrome c oxidoreductase membrane protein n=1 Tax=Coraliomargarita akajimensis (strain DSM 45221 / IAM 15411 / JCM 23193 / KCTC 12865 / 04OKA010-24) TaxID=583355 RepID=D5EKG8_CORAD|nr:DUF3341 domain-containing protein [Coraliomargarita akajimensis]ADE53049.1 conserved hypothetical protein [Coraliomargarita akajimensis DSM 45221]
MAEKYGLIASFKDTPSFFHAAEKVRDAGYKKWDTYSSFPVHGMPAAQGQARSKVPVFTFCGGCCGFLTGMTIVWFMNYFNYPLIVGGKPFFSPVFPFPVMYELTILLSAFGTLGGMFIMNLLPQHYNPLFNSEKFLEVSGDRLVIAIESRDPKYDKEATRAFLEEIGGTDIEEVSA